MFLILFILGIINISGGSAREENIFKGYKNGKEIEFVGSRLPVSSDEYYLNHEAADAFNEMVAVANRDGYFITVTSGFRNNEKQTALYRNRHKTKILVARPKWSNHQSGTAVDIAGCTNRSQLFKWLKRNAHRYGFKNTVKSEPWHWEWYKITN